MGARTGGGGWSGGRGAARPVGVERGVTTRVLWVLVDGLRLDVSRRMPALNRLRAEGADVPARAAFRSYGGPNFVAQAPVGGRASFLPAAMVASLAALGVTAAAARPLAPSDGMLRFLPIPALTALAFICIATAIVGTWSREPERAASTTAPDDAAFSGVAFGVSEADEDRTSGSTA